MADETSIWKKEISFRKKPKAPKADAAPAYAPAAPAKPESTSIWKKEISFRKKPKAESPAFTLTPPPLAAEPGRMSPTGPSFEQPIIPPVLPAALPTAAPPAVEPRPAPVVPPVSTPETAVAVPPVDIPPVTLPSTAPPDAPPLAPPVVPPPAAPAPDALAAAVVAAPIVAEAVTTPSAASQPQPGPTPPAPSRRERREAQRAADRRAKEQRKLSKATDRTGSRHKLLVGLKIGASQIAATQVVNKGGPRVIKMARMPLGPGVVVGGELREPEELAAALKTFFRKNRLPRSYVRLGISNNRIGVRTFEISGIDDPRQLANAVRFRAQEALPIPLDEAVLDYRVLDDRIAEDGTRVRRVLLVVAHRELVERYVAACRKAGLRLVGIDLEAFALLRALNDPARPPVEDATVVCVSIGHDRSTLAVSDGRVCEFTRVLAWGGSALDAALARVLDLTPSAAAPIKHALSLAETGEGAGLDAARAAAAREAMTAEIQTFARELIASLRFYQEQPGSLGIVELLVTGGASACGGLVEELQRLMGIPVRVADPLMRVRVPRKLRKEQASGSLAVAVGLGIED